MLRLGHKKVKTNMPNDNTPIENTNAASAPSRSATVLDAVIEKINAAQNVLVALSSDPSVDELSAALGLSMYLDRFDKKVTAIYSGTTPNALEFLNPEQTFVATADALQDFVIAINKDKADHLRYKMDGDYVKVYITPYRGSISQEDLEFSYGDFNVDLVLAINVPNGTDLDAALREHGRIMHDAVVVNVTTGNPGKFAELEWNDTRASSVSEMIANLSYALENDKKVSGNEATAYLTGIVAATNRFSNERTTASTMQMASRLMESGANHQLISKNITADVDNYIYSASEAIAAPAAAEEEVAGGEVAVEHDEEKAPSEPKETTSSEDDKLLDDLKAAEASLSQAGAEAVPVEEKEPLVISTEEPKPAEEGTNPDEGFIAPSAEKVIAAPAGLSADGLNSNVDNKYSEMINMALNGDAAVATEPAPAPAPVDNPAAAAAPEVKAEPVPETVPQVDYASVKPVETSYKYDTPILPPAPAPKIPTVMDMGMPVESPAIVVPDNVAPISVSEPAAAPAPEVVAPAAPEAPAVPEVPAVPETPAPAPEAPAPAAPVEPTPAAPVAPAAPAVDDPTAFKIPGM